MSMAENGNENNSITNTRNRYPHFTDFNGIDIESFVVPPTSFQNIRARFEQQNVSSTSSEPTIQNTIQNKTKKYFDPNNQELADSVVAEWKYHATNTLKKSSSELIQTPSQCKPQIPRKPDFLKSTTNGNTNGSESASSVQEIIERLNNSSIPLAGSLMISRDVPAHESPSNASTSELSEVSDDQSNRINTRSNSFMLYGNTMPKQVIEEMRLGGHFKKIPSVKSKLPENVGQVRKQPTRRMLLGQWPTSPGDKPNIDSWCSSAPISICLKDDPNSLDTASPTTNDGRNKPVSLIGSSSTSSDDTVFETYEYFGKDEAENRRCSELHGVVYEICIRQRTFLRLLTNICKELVPFVKKIDEKSSHKAFIAPSNGTHVLERLCKYLEPIVGIHEVLYEEFSKTFSHWSALTPDFARIFVQNADFLKICSGFLLVKKDLTDELLATMDQNKYLAQALRLFEDEVLNAPESGNTNLNTSTMSFPQGGGISLAMHLDNVHQNVVRYILLLERYRKLLPTNIAECEVADKAITKLKSVSQAINCSLMDPEYTARLMDIHRKIITNEFDVLNPSRRLIHESRLMKQTRKELQERHLILFSDWILVCKYTYPFDYFDPARIHKIPISQSQIHVEDHVDHACEFAILNPRKSMIFVTKSKKERDYWVQIIEETKKRWIETDRRLQERQRKVSVIQPNQLDDKTPTDPNTNFLSSKNQANGDSSIKVQSGPLWIPDSKATKCMMLECEVKFTKIKRRHHCRQCGYIMCNNCTGKAPVRIKNFECEKVCSECFDSILEDFVQLRHFPDRMVRLIGSDSEEKQASNKSSTVHPEANEKTPKVDHSELIASLKKDPFSDMVRIWYDGGARKIHPRDIFKEPTNRHYHRARIFESSNNERNSHETTLLISGKVHLSQSQKKGHYQVRWARLDSDFSLNFYEAELDAAPISRFFIYGYNVLVNDDLKGHIGTEFTLLHQNQIKTERKDLRVVFRVENQSAADGWQDAFNKLELPLLTPNGISNN